MSDRPEDTSPAAPSHPEGGQAAARESFASVSVRRAPRYYRFMAVGLVVGVVITLILTFGFPEEESFNRLQVFGFVGIFVVAFCVGLGALVAIVLDRTSRKRARTVSAERVEEHETIAVADFVQVTDPDEASAESAAAEPATAEPATAEPAAAPNASALKLPAPEHDEKA